MNKLNDWYKLKPNEVIETQSYQLMLNIFDSNTWYVRKHSSEFEGQKDGDEILVLKDRLKNEIVMSNSAMEIRTNQDFVNKAHGDVLIAGMGISMTTKALQQREEVKSITIIEKCPKLMYFMMPLIGEYLDPTTRILEGDIFEYETEEKFDCIYFDIWNFIGAENYVEMLKLHNKFSKNLKPKGIIDSWRIEDCERDYQIWEWSNK
jgi:spermidine synthase